MSNKNVTLHSSRRIKDDEFYTTYECIENELVHYREHFMNASVLCNCDDPIESNFCKYFLRNFEKLGLKRLVCTSYGKSSVQKINCNNKKGSLLDVTRVAKGIESFNDATLEAFVVKSNKVSFLNGDGDFRSEECIALMKECDIVVTNPPFSLFKELFKLLINENKKFLLIGNQNALTYKEIFPYIQQNKVWTGYQFGEMKFMVPQNSKPRKIRYWVDANGQKWRSLGNAMWLTNLDNERRHSILELKKKYNEKDYQKYDNFDAINVKSINDIPTDFDGIMGVPITIINRYNPSQFEIVGEANHGSDNEYDLFKPTIGGKELFKKILIRKIKP